MTMTPEPIPLTLPADQEPDPTKGICRACNGSSRIRGRYNAYPCGSAYHDPTSSAHNDNTKEDS